MTHLTRIYNQYIVWRQLCQEGKFDLASEAIHFCDSIIQDMKSTFVTDRSPGFQDFKAELFRQEGNVALDNFQRRIYESFHGWGNIEVVIFSGKQGSGKTTSQESLKNLILGSRNKYDSVHCVGLEYEDAHEINYADPIHEINDYILALLRDKYGVNHNMVKNRKLMQLVGSDFGRDELGKFVWIDIAKNRIFNINQQTPAPGKKHIVLIGDCRFQNEFDSFKDAYRVRLHAPEDVRKLRAKKWGDVTHRSEIGLDLYANSGKFDDYIDTTNCGPEHVTTLVMSRLQRGGWVERRSRVNGQPTYQEEIFQNVEYPS